MGSRSAQTLQAVQGELRVAGSAAPRRSTGSSARTHRPARLPPAHAAAEPFQALPQDLDQRPAALDQGIPFALLTDAVHQQHTYVKGWLRSSLTMPPSICPGKSGYAQMATEMTLPSAKQGSGQCLALTDPPD